MRSCSQEEGILSRSLEVVEIAEVGVMLASGDAAAFTAAERRYADSKSDPERRLAARLAAKRALRRLLGDRVSLGEIEVLPAQGGPPRFSLSQAAVRLCAAQGIDRILLSLTHGRTHAAACVLLACAGR